MNAWLVLTRHKDWSPRPHFRSACTLPCYWNLPFLDTPITPLTRISFLSYLWGYFLSKRDSGAYLLEPFVFRTRGVAGFAVETCAAMPWRRSAFLSACDSRSRLRSLASFRTCPDCTSAFLSWSRSDASAIPAGISKELRMIVEVNVGFFMNSSIDSGPGTTCPVRRGHIQ